MKLIKKILFLLIIILFIGFLSRNFSDKTVYITIDAEGNETQIQNIHELLNKNNVSATFFVVGKTAEQYPELFKNISREHTIQCHTNNHLNLKELPYIAQKKEIIDGRETIYTITGENCTYLRAPYLETNEYTEIALYELGFNDSEQINSIMKNYVGDWLVLHNRSANLNWRLNSVLTNLRKSTIVVVHPQLTGQSQENLNAFETYINKLNKKNANFKTFQ